jgi:hypothetical protein
MNYIFREVHLNLLYCRLDLAKKGTNLMQGMIEIVFKSTKTRGVIFQSFDGFHLERCEQGECSIEVDHTTV